MYPGPRVLILGSPGLGKDTVAAFAATANVDAQSEDWAALHTEHHRALACKQLVYYQWMN